MDISSAIIDFEQGDLNREQVLALFQELVNTGMAWRLQGSYGRMARALIERGMINAAK